MGKKQKLKPKPNQKTFGDISYDALSVVLKFIPLTQLRNDIRVTSKKFKEQSENVLKYKDREYSYFLNVNSTSNNNNPIITLNDLSSILDINKGIKKLDISNWLNAQTKNAESDEQETELQNTMIMRILNTCSINNVCRLEELYLYGTKADFRNTQRFPSLQNLKTLNIDDNEITLETLSNIFEKISIDGTSNIKKLHINMIDTGELNISSDNENIIFIPNMPLLEVLDVSGIIMNDNDFYKIADKTCTNNSKIKISSIKNLILEETQITLDRNVLGNIKFNNLESLIIGYKNKCDIPEGYNDIEMDNLRNFINNQCPNLKQLEAYISESGQRKKIELDINPDTGVKTFKISVIKQEENSVKNIYMNENNMQDENAMQIDMW